MNYIFACELASRRIVPSIRAAIVVLLLRKGYTSYQISKMLRLTPAAISQYISKKRGKRLLEVLLSNEETLERLSYIASLLESGPLDSARAEIISAEICSLCALVRKKYADQLKGFPF